MHASPRTGFVLLVGLLALVAGGKAILYDTLDPDCFWHLKVAEQLHRDGIGPIVDRLSFASIRRPWTPYSWLAELGMKKVWDIGGYRAAVAAQAVMQGLIALFLAACCLEFQRQNEGKPRYLVAAVAITAGLFLTLPYLSFRPVTAVFVLLFAIAWLVLRDRRLYGQSKFVWLIVPLTVMATNVHLFAAFVPTGLFILGLGQFIENSRRESNGAGYEFAVSKDRAMLIRYGLLATLTSLACLATPMLPGLVRTTVYYSAQDKMVAGPVIAEMQSFARGPLGGVSGIIVLGVLAACFLHRERLAWGERICLVLVTLLMLKLGRFAPMFALVGAPALAATMPALRDRLLGRRAVVVVLAFILCAGVWRLAGAFPRGDQPIALWLNRHGPETPGYPCAAADFIDSSVPRQSGCLINEFSWGGFLEWRLGGKYQMLLDGRTQVFPASVWRSTYLGTSDDRRVFLSGTIADAALLPAGKSQFRQTLTDLGWKEAYHDERAMVMLPPPVVAKAE